MTAAPSIQSSRQQLAIASVTALGVALVLLVTAVLPVEYGVDPVGAGRAMGLLREVPKEEPALVMAQGEAGLRPVTRDQGGALYGVAYRVDANEFTLGPYDYMEFKYHLDKGAAMLFRWSADGTLNQDFHGEVDGNPEDVRTYEKNHASEANGSFVAPMAGMHGWFWENPGNKPVKIRLNSAGFYAFAMRYNSDKTRQRHETAAVSQPPSTP